MIDLRSDTVTLPTEAMLEAMACAELGDDSREGDPTVRRLEDAAASMIGSEAAILVTSGTMGNLVALLTHGQRGGEVLLDPLSHILKSEMGGIARLAGLFHRVYPAESGAADVSALREMLKPQLVRNGLGTALVCVETTHNSAGGAVVSLKTLADLRALTLEKQIPVHIDGARIFNAAVALNVPVSEISQYADSVSFCISKGLSAPFGSLLCGSHSFIEQARAFRRMVGGGMRQAGVVAASGIVALEHMVERLADDHRRAKAIARGINQLDARYVDPHRVHTNIVMVDVSHTRTMAANWVLALAEEGVDVRTWTPTALRFVTHRHIGDAAVVRTIESFRTVASKLREATASGK